MTNKPHRFKAIVGLAAGVSMLAGCGGPGRISIPGAADRTMSGAVMDAVSDRWPGSEIGSPISAICAGVAGPPAPILMGDFNGDGLEDVILWTASSEGQPRLVAAIGRIGDEYVAVEVGREAGAPVGSLEIGRRGTVYRPANSVVEHFFGQDTLIERGCDQGRTAYFWTGDNFRADKLAD